ARGNILSKEEADVIIEAAERDTEMTKLEERYRPLERMLDSDPAMAKMTARRIFESELRKERLKELFRTIEEVSLDPDPRKKTDLTDPLKTFVEQNGVRALKEVLEMINSGELAVDKDRIYQIRKTTAEKSKERARGVKKVEEFDETKTLREILADKVEKYSELGELACYGDFDVRADEGDVVILEKFCQAHGIDPRRKPPAEVMKMRDRELKLRIDDAEYAGWTPERAASWMANKYTNDFYKVDYLRRIKEKGKEGELIDFLLRAHTVKEKVKEKGKDGELKETVKEFLLPGYVPGSKNEKVARRSNALPDLSVEGFENPEDLKNYLQELFDKAGAAKDGALAAKDKTEAAKCEEEEAKCYNDLSGLLAKNFWHTTADKEPVSRMQFETLAIEGQIRATSNKMKIVANSRIPSPRGEMRIGDDGELLEPALGDDEINAVLRYNRFGINLNESLSALRTSVVLMEELHERGIRPGADLTFAQLLETGPWAQMPETYLRPYGIGKDPKQWTPDDEKRAQELSNALRMSKAEQGRALGGLLHAG
ncbi:MAG: hypothetical protein NT157_06150, partial [Candidatus Micrarchaeota archaeon]|nr:hypothetical protein [Candidatus Micrarchaeota archaeon]